MNTRCCLHMLFFLFCASLSAFGIYLFLGGYYYQSSDRVPCIIVNTTNCTAVHNNGHHTRVTGAGTGTIEVQLLNSTHSEYGHHEYEIGAEHVFCTSPCCVDEVKEHQPVVCLFRHHDLQEVIYSKLQDYFVALFYIGLAVSIIACCSICANICKIKSDRQRMSYQPIYI